MKTILSGVQSSGKPHIANYFGAMKQNIDFSNDSNYKSYIFIANLHSLTTTYDPVKLNELCIGLALDYLALGLNPTDAIFFLQSDVPAHSELSWILSCVAPHGLLERAHSWKDAIAKGTKEQSVGLFTYPVLMAADILLYKPALVPVGKDQKQHVEIARDIAQKFNNRYEDIFPMPEVFTPKEVETINGTDGQKMSKSYGNVIEIFTDEATIKKQVMSIITDSKGINEPKDPEKCFVFQIFKHFLNENERNELSNKYKNGEIGYGDTKKHLLERILFYFKEHREKRNELVKNMDFVYSVLKNGKLKANEKANQTLQEVKKAVGIEFVNI